MALSWTRAVRLAWRGGLAGDGMPAPVVTPGWTRAVMPDWAPVMIAAPMRRLVRGWTRAVMPGWTRVVVLGGLILARGGTRAWARAVAAVAWTRAVIRGWTCAVIAAPMRGATLSRILGATPAVAGTILDLDRVAIPDSGETPGSIRARALAAAGEVFLART